MKDCIFCAIASKDIPSSIVFEDERCVAFKDLHPQAATHLLIVPKTHYASLQEAAKEEALTGHLLRVCALVAEQQGLQNGYRMVTNVGENGCQSVKHLHFHLLGGEKLSEHMS